MWDSEQYIRGNIVLTKMLSWGKWPATACGVCRFNLMYSTLDAADCLALEGYSCLSWQQEGIIFFLPVRASDFPIETSFPTSEKKKKKPSHEVIMSSKGERYTTRCFPPAEQLEIYKLMQWQQWPRGCMVWYKMISPLKGTVVSWSPACRISVCFTCSTCGMTETE